MKTVYLALGSNIGDRCRHLQAALGKLEAQDLRILRVSSLYETAPVGFTAQHWFYNLVVEAETEMFPLQLLTRIAKIELALGRVRTVPNGPRTLDIDILLYGRAVVHSVKFVLAPLAELAPELRHPVTHQAIRVMLDAAPEQAVRRLDLRLGSPAA